MTSLKPLTSDGIHEKLSFRYFDNRPKWFASGAFHSHFRFAGRGASGVAKCAPSRGDLHACSLLILFINTLHAGALLSPRC
jgi:hypothetical protein